MFLTTKRLVSILRVMLKILSWNIRQGGGTRILSICKLIVSSKSDIVILSEFRNNGSGERIRNHLLKHGYRYQAVSAAKPDQNTAAIFSKLPGDIHLFPDSDDTFGDNLISFEFEAFEVFGMYLPHKKKHQLLDYLLKSLPNRKASILAGDFNTGKNYIDQKGNSFWYTDQFDALEKLDYLDAFRFVNKDVKEYSWYSHQGNGYRYDHTFVHNSLKPIVKACFYEHQWREDGVSDHSPMILTLGG